MILQLLSCVSWVNLLSFQSQEYAGVFYITFAHVWATNSVEKSRFENIIFLYKYTNNYVKKM